MSAQELDKETYRGIIEAYFRAFETHDFSQVRFSTRVQFLSPISGITMNGPEAVGKFVSGVLNPRRRSEHHRNRRRLPDCERGVADDDDKGSPVHPSQLLPPRR